MYTNITFRLDIYWRIQLSTKEETLIFCVLLSWLTSSPLLNEYEKDLSHWMSKFLARLRGSVQLLSKHKADSALLTNFVNQEYRVTTFLKDK